MNDEKILIKKRIKNELAIDKYIAFIDFFDKRSGNIAPFIPMIFDEFNQSKEIKYKSITDTSLRNPYEWFKKELE